MCKISSVKPFTLVFHLQTNHIRFQLLLKQRERERAHRHSNLTPLPSVGNPLIVTQGKLFLPHPLSSSLCHQFFSLFLPLPPCQDLTSLSLPLSRLVSGLRKIGFFFFSYFRFYIYILGFFILIFVWKCENMIN